MGLAGQPGSGSRHAVEGLREAGRLLRRPSAPALEACVPHLETAIRHLAEIEGRLRQGDPATDRHQVRGEMREISRELRRVNALMSNAGRFHAGLSRLLAAASQSTTYNGDGRLNARTGPARLRVEG